MVATYYTVSRRSFTAAHLFFLLAATPRYLYSLTELRKVENFTTEVKRIERVACCLATACFAILSRRPDCNCKRQFAILHLCSICGGPTATL